MEVNGKIRDVIAPNEKILLVTKQKGSMFKPDLTKRLQPDAFVVTDKRILQFHPKGLIRGTLGMRAFTDFTYEEIANIEIDRGMFRSTLRIIPRMGGKALRIKDISKDEAAEAFQIIRNQLFKINKAEQTTQVQVVLQQPVKETVTKEVVLIPCQYCRGLMPQTSLFCPTCGAKRT